MGAVRPGFVAHEWDVQFPMFDRIVTKGANKHPLYRYLTAMQPVAVSRPDSQLLEHPLRSGYLSQAPAHGELLWNVEKFLISRSGKVIARFAPDITVDQNVILRAIERQLKAPWNLEGGRRRRSSMAAARVARVRLLNRHTHSAVGHSRQLNARRRFPSRNVGYMTQAYTRNCAAASVAGRLRSIYGECNNFTGRR